MGQKVNALIFRVGIGSFWKIKNYPSDLRVNLIKKFNIYKIIESFLMFYNIEIILYKNYIKFFYIKIYIFIYFYFKKYNNLRYKSLRYIRLKKNILIKKNVLKCFSLKNVLKKKKNIYNSKIFSIRFLKFIIHIPKKFKNFVQKKHLLKIRVFSQKKKKLKKGGSLLYYFLTNKIYFQKKNKLKPLLILKKNMLKNSRSYKNNFFVNILCKKLIKKSYPGLLFKIKVYVNNKNAILNFNNLYFKLINYTQMSVIKYKFFLLENIILFSKNIFRKNNIVLYKNMSIYKKFIFYINGFRLKSYNLLTNIDFVLLKFKFKKLNLEKIIFRIIKKRAYLFFKNIVFLLNAKKLIKVPKISRMWWNHYLFFFTDFLHILYFTVYFRASKLLSIFIAKHINNKKKHYNFLKSIKRVMRFFFAHETLRNFCGIFIQVSGKFQGILRKRKFQMSFGRTSYQSVTRHIDYNLQTSFTRFGVFSIKVWLLYSK